MIFEGFRVSVYKCANEKKLNDLENENINKHESNEQVNYYRFKFMRRGHCCRDNDQKQLSPDERKHQKHFGQNNNCIWILLQKLWKFENSSEFDVRKTCMPTK